MAANVEEKAQVEVSGEGIDYIGVKVIDQSNQSMSFEIQVDAEMKILMEWYARIHLLPLQSLRFLHDGRRIANDDTARKLEMEHEDIIEVYELQTGGEGCQQSKE